MSNIIPEKTLNFKVYIDGSDSLGIADGTIPNVEFMTSEVKGAGIAGVLDSPGIGQIQSLSFELTWRTRPKNFISLGEPKSHTLECYADDLSWDSGNGKYVHTQIRVMMKAVTKSFDLGKLTVGETAEGKTVHEVYYLKMYIGGSEVLEIDKYLPEYKVNGVSYLADMRRALGMSN